MRTDGTIQTWEEMVEREPIMMFSFYLSGRVGILLDLASEIEEHLDRGIDDEGIYADQICRASTLMWLWTLGAYEVVRTICQASECFSPSAHEEFSRLKKSLSNARMPAAKMEKPGQKVPVTSNRSPDGLDVRNRDLLVGDPQSSPDISARFLIKEFTNVFAALTRDDVIGQHEDTYTHSQEKA